MSADTLADNSSAASRWIAENMETLPEFEWVAASGEGLVDHDPDLERLMARVAEKDIDLESIAYVFVEPAGPELGRQ